MGIPTGRSDISISIMQNRTGDVFIAQRGVNADGHAFIDKALTRGAVAVVCEQLPENRPEEVN